MAATQPCLELKRQVPSAPTPVSATSRGEFFRGRQRSRCGILLTPLPSCPPLTCPLQSLLSQAHGEHCGRRSPELRSLATVSSHSVSLLCLNHKSSLSCCYSRHAAVFRAHQHSCSRRGAAQRSACGYPGVPCLSSLS